MLRTSNGQCSRCFTRSKDILHDRPDTGALARDRASDAQSQSGEARPLCARSRVHAADQGAARRQFLHHISLHARGGGDRYLHRRVDGRLACRSADADVGFWHHPKRARLVGCALADSGADLRLRAWHARRVQPRPGDGVPHDAAGARLARDGAAPHHAPRRARLHRRPRDQAGGRDAGARHLHPLAAVDRRQSLRRVRWVMAATAHNAKVMNRFELTKRLVAQLKREEAGIGGTRHSKFELLLCGRRPQNFYMLGSMGLTIPIAFGVALAQPERHVVALEGDGSLLMMLGCLSTIAVQAPKNLTMVVWDNGMYQITGGQPTAGRATTALAPRARGG